MTLRRLVPIALIPVSAEYRRPRTGARHVDLDRGRNRQVRTTSRSATSYTIVTDPLLNQWVNEVGNKLWSQVARRDVPYNVKILDEPDVNSFTTLGGYIYINEGALDFAQSDDELAGVIGHETGHNERRHTVTLPAKVQALNLLVGIASIFSPFIYRFGQLAEAGIIAKMSRADELQADQYGVFLMSRAGYDPDAMVTFMQHLGSAYAEHDNFVDKYFEDHPGVPDRVSHLLGLQRARSEGADGGSGARAGAARPRDGALRDREPEVLAIAQDEPERFRRAAARRSGRDRAGATHEERTDPAEAAANGKPGDAQRRAARV